MNINIEVSGTITQEVKLFDSSISPEEFIKGLKSGEYLTTISHGNGGGKIYKLDGFKQIGEIVYQESCDDLEFLNLSLDN